jgi:hypothetical protein
MRSLGNLIKTINTYLLDKVLPYYLNGPNGERWLVTRGNVPEILSKILMFPPVKAAIVGISWLLSLNRFYYAPDPDDEDW